MTSDDERRLQLIRIDRWLKRRFEERPVRMWSELAGVAIAIACLVGMVTLWSLAGEDPACMQDWQSYFQCYPPLP